MRNVKGPTLDESHCRAFELLRPLVRLLRSAGIPESALRAESERAYRRYARSTPRGLWPARIDLPELARILTVWARDPAFLDDAGSPRRLTLGRGRDSFAQLLRSARASVGTREALRSLGTLRSIRCCDGGRRVRLVTGVLPGRVGTRFLAAPMLDAARRFLETLEQSACGDACAASRLVHRWSGWARIDPRRASELERFVRSSGESFLEAADEKLLACAPRLPRSRRRARRVPAMPSGLTYGVGIYLLREERRARGGRGRHTERAQQRITFSRPGRIGADAREWRTGPSCRRRSPPRRAPVPKRPAAPPPRAPRHDARGASDRRSRTTP